MKAIAVFICTVLLLSGCNKADSTSSDSGQQQTGTSSGVRIGDVAPQFSLHGYPNLEFNLADYKGVSTVVLYFYPKDNTPDCTVEACAFRDTYNEFSRRGAVIVGVSQDNLASHELFATPRAE